MSNKDNESTNSTYQYGLAKVYDTLMQSVDYSAWCDYVESIVKKYGISTVRLLDLACGTGNSTIPFAQKGCEITGVDYSGEMIELAREKVKGSELPVNFEVGDLRNLQIKKSFSLALHYQDGLNYLLTKEELFKAFNNIQAHLVEGGFFVFDLNNPGYYSRENRESFWVEEENFTMVWESSFNADRLIKEVVLLVFVKNGDGTYSKYRELHQEKEHTREEVAETLTDAGFTLKDVLPTMEWGEPGNNEPRLTFIAQKPQK